jgi:hypothetical protein
VRRTVVTASRGRVSRYERMSDNSVVSEHVALNMWPLSGSHSVATLSRPGMNLLCRKLRIFCADTHPSTTGHCGGKDHGGGGGWREIRVVKG